MGYNRRAQRRQGVRYGPPRDRERLSENGVLIGRLLGLGILLVTLGVLAAGAVAFIGERPGPAAVATRSRSPQLTSSPSRSPGSLAPGAGATIPIPSATVAPPSISSPPASVAPQVQIGPGFVTFGTRSNRQLHIIDPRASFSIDGRIVWSAYLAERADSAELRVNIYKIDGTPPTGERLIVDDEVTPLVLDAQIFERRIQPREVLDGPGIYVVRYVRGTEVLSEGAVEITN